MTALTSVGHACVDAGYTERFGVGQEAVQNMVGVIPGHEKQLFIGIFTKFAQSTKGAWEITEPNGLLYDGLKPVLFVNFKISHQAGLAYRSCETSVARVTSHSALPLSPRAQMVLRAYSERTILVTRAEM